MSNWVRNYDAIRPFEIASAAPQHADDAPLPVLKWGAMKVPAMSKVSDLQIEVQEAVGLMPRGLCFLSGFGPDDRKARITSQEFTVMAKAAATEKARELGWLTDEKRQRGWADRGSTKRR